MTAENGSEARSQTEAESQNGAGPRLQIRELTQRYPMLWFAIWLLLGGQLGLWLLESGPGFTPVFIALSLAAGALAYARRWPSWSVLGTLAFAIGLWFAFWSGTAEQDSLSPAANRKSQPIAIRAVIESAAVWSPNPNHRPVDPNSEAWTTQWKVLGLEVKDGQQWKRIRVRSTLRVDGRVTKFLPGDVVEIHGSYRKIIEPTNPGGFDFARLMQTENQFVYLTADGEGQLKTLGRQAYPLARMRAAAVQFVDANVHRWITESQAPMAAALTFGQRQQVDWEDRQELMATGTLHLLAISGMHVEIVAASLGLLCWFLSKRPWVRFLIVVTMCVLYAGLADGKPPVVRAVVMVAAFELAEWQGRKARLTNLLGLAAIVLFVLQARYIQNTGVHLSFLAVAAIGVFVVGKQREKETAWQKFMQESASTWTRFAKLCLNTIIQMLKLSFWVWLATAPLVWYHFNVIAPIAVLLNVLVALPLSLGLLSGLVTGLFGWIPPIGWLAGTVCSQALSLIHSLVETGAQLPGGHWWLPSPSWIWIVGFYTVLAAWLLLFRQRFRLGLGCALLLWLVSGFVWFGENRPLARTTPPSSELSVTFLDVGHGTSVILHFPDNQVWLYDAGHLGDADRSHQSISRALWHAGVSRIDRLVISHADSDHYNAVAGLVQRFQIREIYSTAQFWESQDEPLLELRDNLRSHRLATRVWKAGDTGDTGDEAGVRWRVLHPALEQEYESDNASSLCLLLEYAGQRVLLPGDLDGTGLFSLTHTPPRPCHILMAPPPRKPVP